jgi:hypothetical protein
MNHFLVKILGIALAIVIVLISTTLGGYGLSYLQAQNANPFVMVLWVLWWLVLCVLIGVWAQKRGRSFGQWLGLAALISPLLAGIILMCLKNLKGQEGMPSLR